MATPSSLKRPLSLSTFFHAWIVSASQPQVFPCWLHLNLICIDYLQNKQLFVCLFSEHILCSQHYVFSLIDCHKSPCLQGIVLVTHELHFSILLSIVTAMDMTWTVKSWIVDGILTLLASRFPGIRWWTVSASTELFHRSNLLTGWPDIIKADMLLTR